MRLLFTTLALAGALLAAPAHAGKLRTNHYWGGADLPVSCETVRQYAPAAQLVSADARRELIRKYHVSAKMLRQARKCLK